MNIVTAIPWSRVNDQWIRTEKINGEPVTHSVTHSLIPGSPGLSCGSPIYANTRFYADFYSNIALDIVTEGAYHYPYPFISEKTIRPIVCKRLFIILGPANTLATLHNKGFETFGDIIKEDYDSITDPEERFLSVVKEIENFCAKDLDEIKQYYLDNKQKFDRNFNRLLQLHNEELEQIRSTF
jgi:hypothetical protein